MKLDIPEGGTVPDSGWIICRGNIYGSNYKGLNLDDFQGWYWALRLPAYQWFKDGEMWFKGGWAQRILWIHHVWLGNGRRGKNGAGWQGWDWSLQWFKLREYT